MKYLILIHSNPQPWGHPTGDYVAEHQALPAEQREQMNTEFDAGGRQSRFHALKMRSTGRL